MEAEHDIKVIHKDRKQGKTGLAHGGVAVFFNKNKCSLRKFQLKALRSPDVRDFEILAVRGNLCGIKREVVIFSCYIPPKLNKQSIECTLENLTDAISKARAKAGSPWIIIGGDWNHYDTSAITRAFPYLVKRETSPTCKDALLDYTFTNFEPSIQLSEVCFPIESSTGKSDHSLVCYESIIERPATFAWQTHEYIKLTEKGTNKFNGLRRNESWNEVEASYPNVDKMAEAFHLILDTRISSCFSGKRVRRKLNESPWLTDGLRHLIKKR